MMHNKIKRKKIRTNITCKLLVNHKVSFFLKTKIITTFKIIPFEVSDEGGPNGSRKFSS